MNYWDIYGVQTMSKILDREIFTIANRAHYTGASDIPKLFPSPDNMYACPALVFYMKKYPDDARDYTPWQKRLFTRGHELEPIVALMARRNKSYQLRYYPRDVILTEKKLLNSPLKQYYMDEILADQPLEPMPVVSEDKPLFYPRRAIIADERIRSHMDYTIWTSTRKRGYGEIKTCNQGVFNWVQREGPLEDWIIQVQTGLVSSARDWGCIFVLQPDTWQYKEFPFEASIDLQKEIIERSMVIWEDIQAGSRPERLYDLLGWNKTCQKCIYKHLCLKNEFIDRRKLVSSGVMQECDDYDLLRMLQELQHSREQKDETTEEYNQILKAIENWWVDRESDMDMPITRIDAPGTWLFRPYVRRKSLDEGITRHRRLTVRFYEQEREKRRKK